MEVRERQAMFEFFSVGQPKVISFEQEQEVFYNQKD
jgi:hypothetical protein